MRLTLARWHSVAYSDHEGSQRVGEVREVSQANGARLLASFPDCFVLVEDPPPAPPVEPTPRAPSRGRKPRG